MKGQPYFEFEYQVDDGYVSGSRPQRVRVRLDDFDSDMTNVEIEERVEEAVTDHMCSNVIPTYDARAIAQQIRDLLDKEAES